MPVAKQASYLFPYIGFSIIAGVLAGILAGLLKIHLPYIAVPLIGLSGIVPSTILNRRPVMPVKKFEDTDDPRKKSKRKPPRNRKPKR